MEVGKAVRTKGSGALGRRNRCSHHRIGEGSKIVVDGALLDLPDDLTSEGGLTTRERGYILAGEAFGYREFLG